MAKPLMVLFIAAPGVSTGKGNGAKLGGAGFERNVSNFNPPAEWPNGAARSRRRRCDSAPPVAADVARQARPSADARDGKNRQDTRHKSRAWLRPRRAENE